MKTAFFDSGLGGLSVLHCAMKRLRHEQFIFYADEDNVPYGNKSVELVRELTDRAFAFLVRQEVKAIVVACNTATNAAVAVMREKYDLPIIGMEPAAKLALDTDGTRRVLVVATEGTVHGDKMKRLIAAYDKERLVDCHALQRLVDFAELSEFVSPVVDEYLRRELADYDFSAYSALVLGCTHFNYFKDSFRRLLPPNVRILDGNEGTVRELERRLAGIDALEDLSPSVEYYYSGRRVTDERELTRLADYMARLDEMYEL